MVTSAGASVFKDNLAINARVIENLKNNNALILGKLNMSEWVYYFCRPCPVGYSSIGGQTSIHMAEKFLNLEGQALEVESQLQLTLQLLQLVQRLQVHIIAFI